MAKNGSRKHGRNQKSCQRYRLEGRKAKNKAKKAERYRKHMEKCALRRMAKEEEANGLD